MEEYSRLHAGIGGDNEKLAYNVLKRGLDADAIRAAADDPAALADLGLRYDLTVPLARFYATHRGELPTVFRVDPDRAGVARRAPAEGPLPPVHAVRHRHHRGCLVPRRGGAHRRDARHRRRARPRGRDGPHQRPACPRLDAGQLRVHRRRAPRRADHDRQARQDRPGRRRRRAARARRDARRGRRARGVPHAARRRSSTTRTASARSASCCPTGAPDDVVAHLVGIGEAVAAARAHPTTRSSGIPLVFDPFLVRGMGYYTGTIFELAHPSRRLLARRRRPLRRHDRPLPRPGRARRRVLDRLRAHRRPGRRESADAAARAVVLVHDRDVPLGELLALKAALVARGIARAPRAAHRRTSRRCSSARHPTATRPSRRSPPARPRFARVQAPRLTRPRPRDSMLAVETAVNALSLAAPMQSRGRGRARGRLTRGREPGWLAAWPNPHPMPGAASTPT